MNQSRHGEGEFAAELVSFTYSLQHAGMQLNVRDKTMGFQKIWFSMFSEIEVEILSGLNAPPSLTHIQTAPEYLDALLYTANIINAVQQK